MKSKPKFIIIGAGPIGGILGACLTQAGHYVVLCDILKDHLDAIKAGGLTITGVSKMTVKCERLAYDISKLANFPEADTFVICTKASAMPIIVPEIKKVARPGARIICSQNGLGNEEFLAETFGPDNVLRIVPYYAGDRVGDGKIWMSFFDAPNYIGAMTADGEPLARQVAEIMTEAELETRFSTNIKQYEWEKTVRNAATNPVCALINKRIKDVMDFELTEVVAMELLREGIEVAKATGVTFDEGFLEEGIQHLKKAGYHKPSMLQDVERGARTEIDWINGKIAEYAHAHGLKAPYNQTITALVKGLEMESKAPKEH